MKSVTCIHLRAHYSPAFRFLSDWNLRLWVGVVSVLQASACNTDTTPTQPHRNSNTHRTKNNTTNVVIQQHSRKLLMMDILMSETCWAHKKWNKITSDIKLVFYSSTCMHVLFLYTMIFVLLCTYLLVVVKFRNNIFTWGVTLHSCIWKEYQIRFLFAKLWLHRDLERRKKISNVEDYHINNSLLLMAVTSLGDTITRGQLLTTQGY